MTGVVAGIITIFMSLMGCVAALLQSRAALCCYLVVFVIAWCLQVAGAAAIMAYSTQLSLKNPNTPSAQLTAYDDIQINNAAFSVYQRCCSGCTNNICNNPSPDSWSNRTQIYCQGKTPCQVVQVCTQPTQAKCFKYQTGEKVVVPPYSPDRSVCSILNNLATTGPNGKTVYLVDYADNGGCGGGDPSVFLRNLDKYLSTHMTGIFVVMILIICTESIALPVGIYLVLTRKGRGGVEDQVLGIGEDEGGDAAAEANGKPGSKPGGGGSLAAV